MDDLKTLVIGFIVFMTMACGVMGWSEQSRRQARHDCITAMKDKPASEILAVCK